jgi:hypothetical protein
MFAGVKGPGIVSANGKHREETTQCQTEILPT